EAASNAKVTFLGTTGELRLDDAATFTGTVAGLGNGGDTIDLTGIAFSPGMTAKFKENIGNTSGRLTLSDGVHSAGLTLLGQYAASFTTAPPARGFTGFVLADDGRPSHGTLVSYVHS